MNKNKFTIKYLVYQTRNQKDPESFARLYDMYVDQIFRFVRFKVETEEIAQDITSDIFLRTWQYLLESSRPIDNFNALIYRICRNCVVDHYRKRSREAQVYNAENFEQLIHDRQDITEDIDNKIDFGQIEEKLKLLKEEYREVIILRYVEGLTVSEISKILDKTKSNVRVLIHRALKTLKDIIHD
ncbi:MAG: RNA polymerase sigma factor [Patescibacteria group bacterium]